MIISCILVGMLVFSLIFAIFSGNAGGMTAAFLEGASSAISLCISLGGPLCLWCGLARVMEECGLTETLGRLMAPLFRRLFPRAAGDPMAMGYLTANVSANLLGLGNAATPMGIRAVQRMQTLSGSPEATEEMCRLIVMNTASIQLLPTTVGAVRSAQGAASPFDILPAVWLTSLCSVSVGLISTGIFGRLSGD